MRESLRVSVDQLRGGFQAEDFPFETTDEIESLPHVIFGQKRAERASEFGLKVKQEGYNLFMVGPSGSGKTAYALAKVNEMAKNEQTPEDWCYVYNFESPDHPVAISFPAGQVSEFKQEIETLVEEIRRRVKAAFVSEDFETKRKQIHKKFNDQAEEIWKELENYVKEQNFGIEKTAQGIVTAPLRFGRPISKEEFNAMSEAEREALNEKGKEIEAEVTEAGRRIELVERQLEEEFNKLRKATARESVESLFSELAEKYKDNEKALVYLRQMHDDVGENYHLFQSVEKADDSFWRSFLGDEKARMHRYQVNALVERGKMEGAPVVFESNPSYHNLFGKVEYRSAFGSMTTDFTMIKPGALHMSNGGYLLIQAAELLSHPFSWTMLKRTLKTRQIRIENLLEERALISTAGIKPEPIPLDVKVVLIGSPYLYHLLSEWDEDFHKIFKVKVEFDPDMEKTKEHALEFAAFVKRTAEKESLLPFHRDALAVLLNHSSRMAGDQRKLSTRLQEIEKILVEASFWAREAGETVARAEHIKQALSEQRYRSNRIEERIQEMIADGSIMIDTDGFVVGQINGLAALRTGDYSFGQPHRITAKTYLGRSGILNIERETSLSGSFHDKGVLILSGYLNGKFAQKRPLPISASIAFEQTYSYIDGDSASSAELFALLSSLSETPIDQGIAVTGSVNQNGQLQPVGAVNEKIEAFFDVCVQRGLTGRQGALVPRQNIVHLVLKDEVARAVENGQFHIWAAETVEEGIEILTGEKAETVFQRIERRLDEMTERWKALDAKEKDKSDSSPEITD